MQELINALFGVAEEIDDIALALGYLDAEDIDEVEDEYIPRLRRTAEDLRFLIAKNANKQEGKTNDEG